MRISEISLPELRATPQDPQANILSQIESSIKEIERNSSETSVPETLASDLRLAVTQLVPLAPFPNSVKLQIWKLSYRLWNVCVDISNAAGVRTPGQKLDEEHGRLRQVSADLLFLAADVVGVPSPAFKSASFFYKTGQIWHDLRNFDLANNCFEKATDLTSKIDINALSSDEERKLLLELNIARSRTAWEVADRNSAITLLNRAKNVLFGIAENYKTLANQYLTFGKIELTKNENSGVKEALKLMNEALDLCEKGLRIVKQSEQTLALKDLRTKTLRFIAASHLQMDEFDSVLKCVRVLRDGGGDHHPSLSVLAMKAWLGLGRYGEAEKELRGMVINKGIPEGVWVSAVESYFQAAGTAGAETVKGVFLGLLERCHLSPRAAIRVVHRVVGDGGGGEGAKVRAKVGAELVSDERVVNLFAGQAAMKERSAMHALLWNCGADHFRSKDYDTSAEMFEKSMLYVPHDTDKRILRAKGYRVLCLCHLGLSQLDRAEEYINEAEKLEPNVVSAFLKFKICLKKNDHNAAIIQVQAMSNCIDFTTDFLSLSAHESVSCQALPIATASLAHLLTFYSLNKPMPTPEIVVLRTLITILAQDPQNEPEILNYSKRAHSRASELGPDRFFGKGELGRRERNWFSVNVWNVGARTGKEKKYELCAEFFRLASEFYGVLLDGEVEGNDLMVCKSLILTVSAMIADEKERKSTLMESEIKEAIELLERAGKMLRSGSTSTQSAGEQITTIDPDFFFVYTWSAYDLYSRLSDSGPQQVLLIKQFLGSKFCNPIYVLQIGLSASQGPRANPEISTLALNTCLTAFLASPLPDYQNIALVLRKLISVGSIYRGDTDDGVVFAVYEQAYRIMVGLKEGEYPAKEGKWLAMTAWNRAALPVRLGHIDLAGKWMNMGLKLAGKVTGMQTYRSCMEDCLAGFEKKFATTDFSNSKSMSQVK